MVSSTSLITPLNQTQSPSTAASLTTSDAGDTFAAELSAALKQAFQQMGLNPNTVQVNSPAAGQNSDASTNSGQFVVTVTAPPAPTANADASAAVAESAQAISSANPYRTDVGMYNPLQYATAQTAQNLAATLGATAVQTTPSTGPVTVPRQNMLSFGNGLVANAGLVEQFYQDFGSSMATQMLASQAKLEVGAAAQNPSMAS
ncbi:MAG TPA: hypothetical protein VKV15_06415 [Bryobacteraceae bacterium]|nr:hypothetical protein [Bryobacteraceae bacterium]